MSHSICQFHPDIHQRHLILYHRNAELGFGLVCACLPALNILSSRSQERPSLLQYFRKRKNAAQSSSHVFDGSQPGDPFSRSQLSSVARRNSTDSATFMANHGQAGLSVGGANDSIIKMVSLNQHWERASQRYFFIALERFVVVG